MSPSLSNPEAVRTLLVQNFGLAQGDLVDDTPLFSTGLLDSFHLVDLLTLLEKNSGRRIAPKEVNLENLDTPRRIAGLLATPAA